MTVKRIPFELPQHFVDGLHIGQESREEFWFIFKDSKLLVDEDTKAPSHPKGLALQHSVYMGIYNECNVYVGEALSAEAPAGTSFHDLRGLFGHTDEVLVALAGKASQIILWERTHQYCGQCGSKTVAKANERAKECPSCKMLAFPRVSPVVMVLIRKGDEILLARGVNFPAGFYSALAGFVDPGETLEHCVKREVFEEVGLEVDNLEYFGSQSWPFPHSLMIAFTCEWKSGEITIDPKEILDAQWFRKDNLPLLPPPFSISRVLIDESIASML